MRIVQAGVVFDPAARTPDELLDRNPTLTEWSRAVASAGADVSVVQRFRTDATVQHDGISYRFVADTQPPWLSTTAAPDAFIKAIAAQAPDLVHVNGLIFPQLVAGIRAALPAAAIVLQHRAGEFPIRGSGIVGIWQRKRWRTGLAAADAITVTAQEQATQWRDAGLLGAQRVINIIEAGPPMREVGRDRARAAVDATGDPLILWVGRKTSSIDPETILDGLERALPQLPSAQVMMLFGDDTLLEGVEQRVRASTILQPKVLLSSRISVDEMPNFYAAADVFVSASQSEGSGAALIDALSAGAVPVVSDIPTFRAIAGACGETFPPGDAAGFAAALLRVCAGDFAAARAAARSRYDEALAWKAIAARTVEEYRSIVDARRSR